MQSLINTIAIDIKTCNWTKSLEKKAGVTERLMELETQTIIVKHKVRFNEEQRDDQIKIEIPIEQTLRGIEQPAVMENKRGYAKGKVMMEWVISVSFVNNISTSVRYLIPQPSL